MTGNKKFKIFGVGLPKTGTQSLYFAISRLGYKSVHYPIDTVIPRLHQSDYSCFEENDAYFNCCEWHFAAVNKIYPDSRFIYTWREYDEWIVSMKNHFERYETPSKSSNAFYNRLEIFGSVNFNEDLMETIYWAHKAAIERYFNNKNNFLKFNVSDPNPYRKLCEFLEIPVINEQFPHKNKS